jgi:hypothetical protein
VHPKHQTYFADNTGGVLAYALASAVENHQSVVINHICLTTSNKRFNLAFEWLTPIRMTRGRD